MNHDYRISLEYRVRKCLQCTCFVCTLNHVAYNLFFLANPRWRTTTSMCTYACGIGVTNKSATGPRGVEDISGVSVATSTVVFLTLYLSYCYSLQSQGIRESALVSDSETSGFRDCILYQGIILTMTSHKIKLSPKATRRVDHVDDLPV